MIEFSMLLINNNRSKAYLQNLIENGFMPNKIIVLNDKNVRLPEHTENDTLLSVDTEQKFIRSIEELGVSFDEKEHVLSTIKKHKIRYEIADSIDINSEEVVGLVKNIEENYIIYSGPGGTILRKDVLSQGKKFIHVHPGWLPKYRGSTTIYYSMLAESNVGCSVILFEEGIDEGPILHREKFEINEKNIDFDYVLDPLVRAKTLVKFLKREEMIVTCQDEDVDTNTFYIIHPFLKHCSILKHNSGKENE